jgi:hypothetical protein
MIERIEHDGHLLAMIVSHTFAEPGICFVTPNELSQQLALMCHPAGHVIQAHVHNPVPREVTYTQEVLVMRRGRMRVDFYDLARTYVSSRELVAGDVILLVAGGHGFQALEEIEMIEVKQGPYTGEADKTRIPAATAAEIKIEKRQ